MSSQSIIKKIGVFTSGGDAPGMNAAIRAVVRTAVTNNVEVLGIMQGYIGMIDNKMVPLQMRDMANIIQRGGTILKTGRCPEFMKVEYRKKAADHLRANGIDGLVSSWLGVSAESDESWMIVGDLSALYDLGAPWILSQLKKAKRRIVVINNGGGKIFSQVSWLQQMPADAKRVINR